MCTIPYLVAFAPRLVCVVMFLVLSVQRRRASQARFLGGDDALPANHAYE